MKTVLNVKTDQVVKKEAQALAAHLGIPLSTVVNAYLKEFITSGTFTLSREPKLRTSVEKAIVSSVNDTKSGKNLSPAFSNTKAAAKWLRS